MAGFITPLPVMAELDEEDRKVYEALKPPKSIVVRYGYQKMVAELPYSGDSTPGCGSKLVIRTQRGVELGEMLTTTCANSGCSKSVSRKDMLKYIENSGGKDYPFTDQGRILRVAEVADLNEQARLDGRKPEILKLSRRLVGELKLEMKPKPKGVGAKALKFPEKYEMSNFEIMFLSDSAAKVAIRANRLKLVYVYMK